MAGEAYRAVFLRVHPTGKMVLSLTTEADGKEAQYAQLVADELGIPALDVKVVPADLDRFGEGHGYNTTPSGGTSAAVSSATGKIKDKAKQLAGVALDVPRDTQIRKTLNAVDEMCGFIIACALVKPDRSLSAVEPSTVRKKMKDKAFARGVHREELVSGAEVLGVPFDEHVLFVRDALIPIAPELGLNP